MIENPTPSLERLRSGTLYILDSERPVSTLRPQVIEMTQLLSNAGTFRIDPRTDISHGETPTPNGMACSPTVAAMCAADFVRTIQFIRGTYAAIVDIRKRIPDRPARVLYVGCGPYATLAVPLMAVFAPKEVSFTLIDIHGESIDSVKSIVDALGLSNFVTHYETMDAGSYHINPDRTPDIIMMEIMQVCLKKEPQVAITRHLLQQAPEAILIPEEVRIDLALVNRPCEFAFNRPQGERSKPQRDRIPLATVFVLNRESVDSWKNISGNKLPGAVTRIPDPMEAKYQPMLLTTVRVYQDHVLKDYNSSLSCPQKLSTATAITGGDTIQFHYELDEHPQLVAEILAEPISRTSLEPA